MIERDCTLNRIAVAGGKGSAPPVVIEPGGAPDAPMGLYKGSPTRAKVTFPTAPYLGQRWTASQLYEWAEVFAQAAEAQEEVAATEVL